MNVLCNLSYQDGGRHDCSVCLLISWRSSFPDVACHIMVEAVPMTVICDLSYLGGGSFHDCSCQSSSHVSSLWFFISWLRQFS